MHHRCIFVVCLPGSVGPSLAHAVRANMRTRHDRVWIIGLEQAHATSGLCCIDPLGGLAAAALLAHAVLATGTSAAWTMAHEVRWLLWEHHIQADTAVKGGSPERVVAELCADTTADAIIIGLPARRSWGAIERCARRSASDQRPIVLVRADPPPFRRRLRFPFEPPSRLLP